MSSFRLKLLLLPLLHCNSLWIRLWTVLVRFRLFHLLAHRFLSYISVPPLHWIDQVLGDRRKARRSSCRRRQHGRGNAFGSRGWGSIRGYTATAASSCAWPSSLDNTARTRPARRFAVCNGPQSFSASCWKRREGKEGRIQFCQLSIVQKGVKFKFKREEVVLQGSKNQLNNNVNRSNIGNRPTRSSRRKRRRLRDKTN